MTRALLAVAVVVAGGCAGPDGAGRRDGQPWARRQPISPCASRPRTKPCS